MVRICLVLVSSLVIAACTHTSASSRDASTTGAETRRDWALALHGGAGVIDRDLPAEVVAGYRASLESALHAGADHLAEGGDSLDAVELVVRLLEDDERFNAGRGAVFTSEGRHELDASIMDGRTAACGAVTGVRTVRHPVTLARRVMERSRHVFFAGDGAEVFANEVGVERVENDWFSTSRRREALRRAQERELRREDLRGTVGCVALDRAGNLAAATSTGGMTNKRYGRIGDSPVIGAGTWAENGACAVSCTGTGEEFIRHNVARSIAAAMKFGAWSLDRAAGHLIEDVLAPRDGGLIAVSANGEIAMPYSSKGMFRGAADAAGRFEVAIWEN